MRNKMLIILGVIILLFAGLILMNSMKNKEALDKNDNPYGTDKLTQDSIDLLDDPLYQNIIVPDDLDKQIDSGEPVTVYYFSPRCTYCMKTTPIVMPVAEEMDVDLKKMNLLEFDKMDYYEIEGTPTIIHYDDGEEVARIVGQHPEEDFEMFFQMYVVN